MEWKLPKLPKISIWTNCLILLFSLLLRNKEISGAKIVKFSIVNTLCSIFMLQIEQYNIIARNFRRNLGIFVLLTEIWVYYSYYHILLSQKSWCYTKLILYLSTFFAFILTMNLVFNEEIWKLEIYGFGYNTCYFVLWLFSNQYEKLNFGKFEK